MKNGVERMDEVAQLYWTLSKDDDNAVGGFMKWAEEHRVWSLTEDEFAAFKTRVLRGG